LTAAKKKFFTSFHRPILNPGEVWDEGANQCPHPVG